MLLTQREEFFKVQLTIAIRIMHVQDALGYTFRYIIALMRLNQLSQLSFRQISIAVCVVLKSDVSNLAERLVIHEQILI